MEYLIKHQEALEFLKTLKDSSVNLVVTDPPYILTDCGYGGIYGESRAYHNLYSKELKANLRDGFDFKILDEIKRVNNPLNAYFFCNTKLLVKLLEYFKNDKIDILVYHKKNPIPSFNKKYLSDLEYILFVCNERNLMQNTFSTSSKLFSMNIPIKETLHPTEKPLCILKTLIQNSSQKGDVVLDCFLGSGSTLKASLELDRKFLGCEIKKEYFNMALKRIKNLQKNLL
ncbi:DNA-methyltransferase, partial [Helicobacter mesocricetorum]|uniref:DNA-methyltransferase n=1 Tax=Helicobacter mesocricetorum TaxID=87012 RepID=UPI000CF15EC3